MVVGVGGGRGEGGEGGCLPRQSGEEAGVGEEEEEEEDPLKGEELACPPAEP